MFSSSNEYKIFDGNFFVLRSNKRSAFAIASCASSLGMTQDNAVRDEKQGVLSRLTFAYKHNSSFSKYNLKNP